MSQQHQESRLRTADMATAAEQRESKSQDDGSRIVISPESTPVERRQEDKAAADRQAPLFDGNMAQTLRGRWGDIQAGFVDEPRRSVEQADSLVAEVMQQLAQAFSQARSNLERQWDREGDVNTEDLRQALRRYRSFFDRLLSM